jgi:hypothetical protein
LRQQERRKANGDDHAIAINTAAIWTAVCDRIE